MAKKQIPLDELVEQAVRDALGRLPELRACSEIDYCNAVLEGLSVIAEGMRMRLQELEDESGS